MIKSFWFLTIISLFLLSCSPNPKEKVQDFSHYFDEYQVEGAFVLYDLQQDQYVRYNPERCQQSFTPASTYKIFNSMVSLETEVIEDANSIIHWDGSESWNEVWNRDHTLQSAFQVSCVPCYQQLARKVGEERMQHYIDKNHYGNQDISGGIDMFWLTGNLRISPNEQIELLKNLYFDKLEFSERTMRIVKDIMLIEQDSTHILRGKTGWGVLEDTNIGWFVGYIEKDENAYFFATNIESAQPEDSFAQARKNISFDIMRELGILE